MATQNYSKEYQTFMNFMESYEHELSYLCSRLSIEWKYEKEQIIEIIKKKLNELGPVKDYSKGQKITLGVALGNNRIGRIDITKSKYTYGVVVLK